MRGSETNNVDGDAAVTKRYKACGRVVLRTIGDETLLVPVSGPASGGRVYPINETAGMIWDGLSAGDDAAQVAERLADTFAVSREQAHADCVACAETMVAEALLEELI